MTSSPASDDRCVSGQTDIRVGGVIDDRRPAGDRELAQAADRCLDCDLAATGIGVVKEIGGQM